MGDYHIYAKGRYLSPWAEIRYKGISGERRVTLAEERTGPPLGIGVLG